MRLPAKPTAAALADDVALAMIRDRPSEQFVHDSVSGPFVWGLSQNADLMVVHRGRRFIIRVMPLPQ